MNPVRCKCGHMLADKGEKVYEIKIKSGKNIDVSFPEGVVKCPGCGTVYFLPRCETNTIGEAVEIKYN